MGDILGVFIAIFKNSVLIQDADGCSIVAEPIFLHGQSAHCFRQNDRKFLQNLCNFQWKQSDRRSVLYYFNMVKTLYGFSCRKCIPKTVLTLVILI